MAEMQKPGRPSDQKPDEWQQDLNPKQMEHSAQNASTAYDIKELQNSLDGYTSEELKQILVLAPGSRLREGSTYINLRDPARREFTATGVWKPIRITGLFLKPMLATRFGTA